MPILRKTLLILCTFFSYFLFPVFSFAQMSIQQLGLNNTNLNWSFGSEIACGDVNDDGIFDIVAAEIRPRINGVDTGGRVHLFYGNGGEYSINPDKSLLDPDNNKFADFGRFLTIHDLNNDGIDDVIVRSVAHTILSVGGRYFHRTAGIHTWRYDEVLPVVGWE